ncbi:hypothetical protein MKX01_015305, partial [Papaver californicum]
STGIGHGGVVSNNEQDEAKQNPNQVINSIQTIFISLFYLSTWPLNSLYSNA